MAILSNINGKFAVDSSGGIQFSGQTGTSGYVLKSNGNAAPTWVDVSTVIGGPYLPLSGGTLTGATATASGISFTVGGVLTGQANSNTFGTASASGRALIVQSGSSNQAIMLKNNLGGDGTISATGTATTMNYSFGTYSVAPALFIQNDGKVGIATDLPDAKLQVQGNVKVGSASGASWTDAKDDIGGLDVFVGSGSNAFQVWDDNQQAYPRFKVERGGNVGIGTTSPQEKLHVVGLQGSVPLSSYYGSLVVDNNGEAAISIIGNSYSSIYFGDAATNFAGAVVYNHSANAMEFRTTTNAEKMRITSDGTVIIGAPSSAYNTTQGYSFHAVADYTAQSYISIARKGQTSGSQGVVIGLDTSNAYIQVRDNINLILGTNNQGQQWIQPNGNVGIGISGPNSRLSVLGVIQNQDAYADPSFTVTSVGMSVVGSGSIQFTQGWAGTSAAGDTVVFRYNAASWKSWNLDYTFSSTNGMVKGTIGGYNNNSGGGSNAFLKNDFSITCVGTNVGQSVVVTFTGNFGIHMNCNMRYSQGGGDGAPQSTRAFLTYNS